MSEAVRCRRLELAGTYNVRDVGGYPTSDGGVTRSGVLLRGDSLHRLAATGRDQLAALGLRTVVDLRTPDERDAYPSRVEGIGAQTVQYPLSEDARSLPATEDDLGARYLVTLERAGQQLAGIIRVLAAPERFPALVHCMAGKDRTGLVIALVLSAVGVDDQHAVADYAASGSFLGTEYRAEATARALARGLTSGQIERLLAVDPAYMQGVLDQLRSRHGGTGPYLLRHGLLAEELLGLKGALVANAVNPLLTGTSR